MKAQITYLRSADRSQWSETLASDQLPARPSGPWIETKHRVLTYYANLFATGMRHKWENRVYLELFSGPGKCFMRDTGKEDLGSPLKVIGHDFTHFIFTEMSVPAAEALAKRLEPFPNAEKAHIWCGDCAEAIQRIHLPPGALTLAFIDPTGIGHAPFTLIQALQKRTRCDLLINIQHGMGTNTHPMPMTLPRSQSFLDTMDGRDCPGTTLKSFLSAFWTFINSNLTGSATNLPGREVLISNRQGSGLYLLLFASGHPRGKEFWEKSLKGVLPPELDLGI